MIEERLPSRLLHSFSILFTSFVQSNIIRTDNRNNMVQSDGDAVYHYVRWNIRRFLLFLIAIVIIIKADYSLSWVTGVSAFIPASNLPPTQCRVSLLLCPDLSRINITLRRRLPRVSENNLLVRQKKSRIVACSFEENQSVSCSKIPQDVVMERSQGRIHHGIERRENRERYHSISKPRRWMLQKIAAASAATFPLTVISAPVEPAHAAFPRFPFFNSKYSLSVVTNSNTTAASSIRQPSKESSMFSPELATESCLLKLLPVKKPLFRELEGKLLTVSSLRSYDFSGNASEQQQQQQLRAFENVIQNMNETLYLIDSKRSNLEPVFNMDDSTVISITKATKGENLVESLRNEIATIETLAQARDLEGIFSSQKRALRILAEIGELLVEKFPYDVPKDGKFGYLPRLLGRTKVTFTIVRPTGKRRMAKDEVLGNVTILADGFAAPITAGNFVDLSIRNFYTGLPVKVLKKRLGVKASLTMAEDSLVAYDIASTVDKIAGEDSVIKKSFGSLIEGLGINAEESDDNQNTVLTSMPILGSFNEGFYDPLTAKPRRIPLEIVQYDTRLRTAKLSYESGFTSNTASANSTLLSVLTPDARSPPLLTFDIPGLVALNHPDLNLNGGSSEFFSLTEKDLVAQRSSLLNGQYAPFGYVLEGFDLMKNLQAGDLISATYVDEWGQMNLKKIRGTSFADALNSDSGGGTG